MSRRLALRMVRLAASVTLVCALVWLTDPQAALTRLRDADWRLLLAAFALLHVVTVLQALRWRLTARALGLGLSRGRAVGEYYLAQMLNQTLPGGVLGDVARAVRARRGADWASAAHSVVIERALGQAAMICIGMLGLGFAVLVPGGTRWPAPLTLGLAAVSLAGAAAVIALRSRLPPGLAAAFRRAILAPGMAVPQAALSLSAAALTVAAFWTTTRATGTSIAPADAALLIPLVLSAMLVPLGIAGWGWREGAAAALFPLIGAGAEAGVAAGIAYGTLLLCANLPGALWPLRHALEPTRDPANLPPHRSEIS